MVALGTYLLVSVAAASSPVHGVEKLASTFDEAYCDVDDSGECAVEPTLSVEMPAAVLDCASPFIQEMIGSCDLPKQAPPTAHAATLRNGGTTLVARADSGRVDVITAPSTADGALLAQPPPLHRLSPSSPVVAPLDDAIDDVSPPRLDRPPRV
ncbi:MAG: hypothetical protein JWN44_1269 [Myxococcales bacterium]|nr:hypothetical protein [Myxococcales bacterium]